MNDFVQIANKFKSRTNMFKLHNALQVFQNHKKKSISVKYQLTFPLSTVNPDRVMTVKAEAIFDSRSEVLVQQ